MLDNLTSALTPISVVTTTVAIASAAIGIAGVPLPLCLDTILDMCWTLGFKRCLVQPTNFPPTALLPTSVQCSRIRGNDVNGLKNAVNSIAINSQLLTCVKCQVFRCASNGDTILSCPVLPAVPFLCCRCQCLGAIACWTAAL